LFLIPVSIFNSCIESDQESIKIESEIKKILDDNNFTLDYIDRYGEKGIKVSNLIEFENLIIALNGKVYDPIAIDNILSQNNLEALPYLNLNYNSLSNKFRQNQRINCVDSWRTVYGRIGIGSSATYIDISFQTGTGSGEISNWDAALGGLTFMIVLGKIIF
jgi:hypothetical protein